MGKWPAVEVSHAGDPDPTLAFVDDFSPTAIEEGGGWLRIFFALPGQRDAAATALLAEHFTVRSLDVDDEDWARRSQADLRPVTVGRITIDPLTSAVAPASRPAGLTIAILPSTGFGTGHHATTRLCLRALQDVNLTGKSVLDVGTGSGVLAIAAVALGAARALGIDYDPDAVRAARENLELNAGIEGIQRVEFRVADLASDPLPPADIVTANLTGAVLRRFASLLLSLVRPGGTLVVSGLLDQERDEVVGALGVPVAWERREDGWVALGLCCN